MTISHGEVRLDWECIDAIETTETTTTDTTTTTQTTSTTTTDFDYDYGTTSGTLSTSLVISPTTSLLEPRSALNGRKLLF